MSVKITKTTSVAEIAALVCEALRAVGIEAILTGGAVVTIYSKNEYESYDLDFILLGLGKNIDQVMQGLGFKKEKGRHYTHPHTNYFVEFPGNTLAIGDGLDTEVVDLKTKRGVLKLLSPTDCVKDRLAAYFHWNDRQGLEQALMVARQQSVSLERIKKWAKSEGFTQRFQEFTKLLNERAD